MPAIEIKKNIYCVGAVDWNLRDFHGYTLYKGTTYNSFLVIDEKIALFDTVKKDFKDELLNNIQQVTDPEGIDYIIINHVEMDHSGCLPEIMDIVRPEKLICSKKGREALLAHFHREDWPYEVVETGSTLSLGGRTISFIETRMLHWPDSMFSYIKEDRLLISSDAFGQHWATSERFDDEVDRSELFVHAAEYYANILMLYSPLVKKLLDDVGKMGLQIDMIAPDHGLIWRKGVTDILDAYASWCQQKAVRKALVVYDSMWNSTAAMARAIIEGLTEEGVSTLMFDLGVSHRSDVVTEAMDAAAVIFGSSTLNNNMLPRVADLLTYMKGLRFTGKIGAAFGSYGWSGEAVKLINRELEEMKFQLADPGLKIRYVPDGEGLEKCHQLGKKIGRMINNTVR